MCLVGAALSGNLLSGPAGMRIGLIRFDMIDQADMKIVGCSRRALTRNGIVAIVTCTSQCITRAVILNSFRRNKADWRVLERVRSIRTSGAEVNFIKVPAGALSLANRAHFTTISNPACEHVQAHETLYRG